MNEQEWLGGTDPTPMIEFLRGNVSDRKCRLLNVACCRRIWKLLAADCKNLNIAQERYADGLVTTSQYQVALDRANAEAVSADYDPPDALSYATASVSLSNPPTVPSITSSLDTAASAFACSVAENAAENEYDATFDAAWTQERWGQVRLVLDIFGNPFRPVAIDPRWLTSNVVDLAGAIYEERAFEKMPILADALMDAGCDSEEIINHCRGDGPHVRGCWVVDLLTGKS